MPHWNLLVERCPHRLLVEQGPPCLLVERCPHRLLVEQGPPCFKLRRSFYKGS